MKASATFPLDKIAKPLLKWFRARARSLPWRDDPRPYYVWVSEIMLQQTRVTAVLPYFSRFITALPDVRALAAVDDDALMKLWEGLGYYSRARNLKKAAALIMEKHGGIIPHDFDTLLSLPGVGRYTAGAVASIAYGQRVPAVDGNVLRVVSRLTASRDDILRDATKRAVENALAEIMPKDAGQFNQAMMELGALVCTPKNPNCASCPLKNDCQARRAGTQADYPVRTPRKAVPTRRATVVVATDAQGRVLLARNSEGGLLKGLWELPTLAPACAHVQVFSHFRQELSALRVAEDAQFVDPEKVPLATATRRVLEKCGLMAPGRKAAR
jgi:A/G-specific adenine glycosylase